MPLAASYTRRKAWESRMVGNATISALGKALSGKQEVKASSLLSEFGIKIEGE